MKSYCLKAAVFLLLATNILVSVQSRHVEAQACLPSGTLRGEKPPPGQFNGENDSESCEQGKLYMTYNCSPPVSACTTAVLTLNSFEKGGDGGGPSECDKKYHNDSSFVVALSTGWFDQGKRCQKSISIRANGRRVKARVVDECDSTVGCDEVHDFQPPCPNNIVDGSAGIWTALGIPKKNWGLLNVTWSDA